MTKTYQPFFANANLPWLWLAKRLAAPHSSAVLGVIVLVAGLLVDLILGHDAFARAGSVLVVFAILVLWASYGYGEELRAVRSYSRILSKDFRNIDWELPPAELAKNFSVFQKSPEAALVAAVTMKQHREILPQNISDLEALNKSLLRAQVLWAAIGTIVWGFGDLVVPASWGQFNEASDAHTSVRSRTGSRPPGQTRSSVFLRYGNHLK